MTPSGDLFAECPLVVAPMAGGLTTPQLVAAAASAGAFGFLAAGYKSAVAVEGDIGVLHALSDRPFGVNVFVPGRPTGDPEAVARYVRELEPDAAALDVALGAPRWDDDDWTAKLDLLVETAPAVISFTFGCPSADIVRTLQHRGSAVMVTVTSPVEALAAVAAGADLVCAQGIEAGAHRSTFDDTAPDDELSVLELVAAIRSQLAVPVVAAGGLATPDHVRGAIDAGAVAVQVGTAFLRCDKAGTKPVHRAALGDDGHGTTTMTRAFTGRRARGIVNDFVRRHGDAPSAYPEIHHVTRPLRAAAAATGDGQRLHLWAGTGFRHARSEPAAEVVTWLTG